MKGSVQLDMELNIASLGYISFDGSKYKSNNTKHKAMVTVQSHSCYQEGLGEVLLEIRLFNSHFTKGDLNGYHSYGF